MLERWSRSKQRPIPGRFHIESPGAASVTNGGLPLADPMRQLDARNRDLR